jgi:hypothetical protein
MMSEDELRRDDEERQEKYAHARVGEIKEELEWVQGWLEFGGLKELLPNDGDLDRAVAEIDNILTYWMEPLAAQMSYWTPSGEHPLPGTVVRPEGYTDDEWLAFIARAATLACGTKPRPI